MSTITIGRMIARAEGDRDSSLEDPGGRRGGRDLELKTLGFTMSSKTHKSPL